MYTHEYSNDFIEILAVSIVVAADAGKSDVRQCY
jgi:hypothetical protein